MPIGKNCWDYNLWLDAIALQAYHARRNATEISELDKTINELDGLTNQIEYARRALSDEIRDRLKYSRDLNKPLIAAASSRVHEISRAIHYERRVVEVAEVRRNKQEEELRSAGLSLQKIALVITPQAETDGMKVKAAEQIAALEAEQQVLVGLDTNSARNY